MAIYYIKPAADGGNDSNDGLSYNTALATFNAAEAKVTAGDIVRIAPGRYRQTHTCTTSGSSGNPITFYGDVSGVYTDQVGGEISITGSDDDINITRSNGISVNSRSYRFFIGIVVDLCSANGIDINNGNYTTIEDCNFNCTGDDGIGIVSGTNLTVRRCNFTLQQNAGINISNGSAIDNAAHVIENIKTLMVRNFGVRINNVGGVIVRDSTINGADRGVHLTSTLSGTATKINVYDCIFVGNDMAVQASTSGDLLENFNNFYGNHGDRTNVAVGANSNTYPPLFRMPRLLAGHRLEDSWAELSSYSPLRNMTGSNAGSTDFFGLSRPATASKHNPGAIQYVDFRRDTANVYNGGESSVCVADAGEVPFILQVEAGKQMTLSFRVKWEANYAGTAPQLIVREPGQSDRTATASGSAGTWVNISLTFTPAWSWVSVALKSNNTATSGSYAIYFDKEAAA